MEQIKTKIITFDLSPTQGWKNASEIWIRKTKTRDVDDEDEDSYHNAGNETLLEYELNSAKTGCNEEHDNNNYKAFC